MKRARRGADTPSSPEEGQRALSERRRRMLRSAAAAFACNLLYALYHGALGLSNRSQWFLAMCAFYAILAVMRFSAVLCGLKTAHSTCADAEYRIMRCSGVLLVVLSCVLAVVNFISLSQNIAAKHGEIVMISIATYTFYKITTTAVKAVTQRKTPSALLSVILSISCAEAAASVLTLQRSMLVSFGAMAHGKIQQMNAATGAAVCAFVLILGISMVKQGKKKGA